MTEALEANGRRLIETGTRALPAPVASCPGWDVARLLTHLSHIYDWATRNLSADGNERVRLGRMSDIPIDPQECTAALDALLGVLRTVSPDAPCAGPLTPRTAAWWARRQLLETVVHRWDVENAVGAPSEIDPTVAALGVAEFEEVFAAGQAIPVKVHATADELFLLLWGRIAVDDVVLDGDRETYRAWRVAIAT
jgi:uncharacterized protein (TIGR03083 family)